MIKAMSVTTFWIGAGATAAVAGAQLYNLSGGTISPGTSLWWATAGGMALNAYMSGALTIMGLNMTEALSLTKALEERMKLVNSLLEDVGRHRAAQLLAEQQTTQVPLH